MSYWIPSSTYIKILHAILEKEYELYRKTNNLNKVFLDRNQLIQIISSFTSNAYKILNDMINKGLLIEYNMNKSSVYRSLYFDSIHDIVNIRPEKISKPTVFEYLIVGNGDGHLKKEPLPLFDIQCTLTFNEIYPIVKKLLINAEEDIVKKINRILKNILCLRDKYSRFQHESIIEILKGMIDRVDKIYAIRAPTGWGKTEAFLIPILIYATIQKILGKRGIKAILIYPRKALASNQIKRIIVDFMEIMDKAGISNDEVLTTLPLVAIRDGQSTDPSKYNSQTGFRVSNVKRKVKINNQEKIVKFTVEIDSYQTIKVKPQQRIRGIKDEYILPVTNTHFEKIGIQPDILITNLDTFNRMLITPRFNIVWQEPSMLAAIVFDEAHTYNGVSFLHLTYILRRINSFLLELYKKTCGKSTIINKPVIVFSSATLQANFRNEITKALRNNNFHEISFENSIDPERSKIVIPVIIAPQPDVAGQWIVQLITTYYILFGIKKALEKGVLAKNEPVPYKSLVFIDSLNYLRNIKGYINILLNRLDVIAANHTLNPFKEPINDRDHWSFVDDNLITYLRSNRDFIARESIGVHYGTLGQSKREEIEEKFIEKTLPITLLSTSTLELGIDIPDLWSITQFRPPFESESFIQRIGRAGRSNRTNRVALGFLVLTNQPSDIIYIYDKDKQNSLFSQSSLRVPLNDTILDQHIFLSIFDYLNLKKIAGELSQEYDETLNAVFYKPTNSIEEELKRAKRLLLRYKDEIIEYVTTVFLGNENQTAIKQRVCTIFDEVINDILSIEDPYSLVDKIKEKGIIDLVIEIIKRIIEDYTDQLRKFRRRFRFLASLRIGEIEDTLTELKMELEEIMWKKEKNSVIQSIMEIYYQYPYIIENYIEQLEQFIDEHKDEINMIKNKEKIPLDQLLIGLREGLKDLLSRIKGEELFKKLIDVVYESSKIMSIATNMTSYLAIHTRKGIYYSTILSIPVKHVEINYGGHESRPEPLQIALNRLANYTVYKPLS